MMSLLQGLRAINNARHGRNRESELILWHGLLLILTSQDEKKETKNVER